LEADKHVLCEKPLCADVNQARALIGLAQERSRVLMTGHVFLFNPGIVELKRLLDRGEAGRFHYFRALRTNFGPVRADVNCVYDLASHDVAIFSFLLGCQPVTVSATGSAFLQAGIEDVAFITLQYPGGVAAHIHVSWLAPRKIREILVVGARKMIVWDDLASTGPLHIYDRGAVQEPYYEDYGQFQLLARDGAVTATGAAPEEPLKIQNSHFIRAVRENRTPTSDGQFGLTVLSTLEAITASMQAGGAPVRVIP
jgi:predicted dehydrogenase